jgi:UDP-N-acetylmuramoylalanine--D-glutamate ligase
MQKAAGISFIKNVSLKFFMLIPFEAVKFKNKKIGIYGLGKTGVACFEYFVQSSADLICYDDSREAVNSFAKKYGVGHIAPLDDGIWQTLDYIIASPGIPLQYPLQHELFRIAAICQTPIISDIEVLCHSAQEASFIGITGTNGKSTTTELLGHILAESGFIVGGNIGVPCLSMPKSSGYILEISSYQLDLLKNFKPKVAAITNITPDHLDRYPSMKEYSKSKVSIAKNMDQNDSLVINIDDAILNNLQYDFEATRLIKISLARDNNADIYYDQGEIVDLINAKSYAFRQPESLPSKHNLYNILIAYAVSISFKLPAEYIIEKIQSFSGIAHRLQFLGTYKHIGFYNDSKATNAEAAKQALSAFNDIFWLAGGIPKAGGINSIAHTFAAIQKAYFFGQARFEFLDFALKQGLRASIFENLEDAFAQAFSDAIEYNKNCNILLSPACSSFDQFKNFEERGIAFSNLVKQVIHS